jgi:hypothetical protein
MTGGKGYVSRHSSGDIRPAPKAAPKTAKANYRPINDTWLKNGFSLTDAVKHEVGFCRLSLNIAEMAKISYATDSSIRDEILEVYNDLVLRIEVIKTMQNGLDSLETQLKRLEKRIDEIQSQIKSYKK